MPFFTIVIPTFNCADFIRQTVEMVKGQSFRDWEMVVVDDGSTDQTWEILKEFAVSDSRIMIDQRPQNRRKGPSACRNIGVENSSGQYIAFLDADDEWSIDRLQCAYNYIQETGANAIYSGAWVVDLKGKYFRESRSIRQGESIFDFTINGDSFAQTSTLMVKSEIAKQVAFPEAIRFHEDFAYFIEVGEMVSWSYYPSKDVLVRWEDNHLKKVDYKDCLWFYDRFEKLSTDRDSRVKYLKYMLIESIMKKSELKVNNSYKKLLSEENYRFNFNYIILIFAPRLYRLLFSIWMKFKY
ncbi:glycosyltransferase family 2 protein [Litoribacter populi]|uniref:glycosyltransferase family 2 protein n=1 Tax=Litoribacter populi TaxID=2598460 RepID=UPI00163DD9AF|nr:glycosyltransferase family 2 protein [Litoribacter populi]